MFLLPKKKKKKKLCGESRPDADFIIDPLYGNVMGDEAGWGVDRTGPSLPLGASTSRVDTVDRNGYSPLLTNAAADNITIGGLGRNGWRGGDGESPSGPSGLRSCALFPSDWIMVQGYSGLLATLSIFSPYLWEGDQKKRTFGKCCSKWCDIFPKEVVSDSPGTVVTSGSTKIADVLYFDRK